jgi:hypothetical protein
MANIQTNQRPSSLISHLPYAVQMEMLRADIRAIRRDRGALRKQGEWVRAHFVNRLADAKAAA